VLRELDTNGVILVKGTWNNPSIKKIERDANANGFELREKNVLPSKGYTQSDGTSIKNDTITEYIFKRK